MDFIQFISAFFWIAWFIIPFVFLVLAIVAIYVVKDKKRKLKLIVLPVLALAVTVVSAYTTLLMAFSAWYNDDLVIKVPDSEVQIVVKEWYDFGGNGVHIYVKRPIGKEYVTSMSGGDEYCLFENGYYELINNGDGTATIILRDPDLGAEYVETFEIE